jgi:beta-lactamase regulating signal transducer with metallopeptidase domain
VNLLGAKQELGTFFVTARFTYSELLSLKAQLAADSGALRYSQSVGDLAFRALLAKVGTWAPSLIVAVLLSVALGRLAVRFVAWTRFAAARRGWLRSSVVLEMRRVGFRSVAIRLSTAYNGVPFASGFSRPVVVLSAEARNALSDDEAAAVVEHELAHVRHFDSALLGAVHLLSDLFWFLPGISALVRRIAESLEFAADAAAVGRGAKPERLASALVSVGERLQVGPTAAPGLGGEPRALSARVLGLIGSAPQAPRFIYRSLLGRVVLFVVVGVFVVSSVALGNSPF